MKAAEEKQICIGNIPQVQSRYSFDNAISSLRELITSDKVKEYGEELTTDVLRDLLSGGDDIRSRMLDKFNASLTSVFFPAERRQKEEVYKALLLRFDELVRKIRNITADFKYIPIEAYTVGTDSVEYDSEIVESAFAEAGNVYISKPSQVEVYKAAKRALQAIRNLDTLAQRYGMYAVNKGNHRSIINIDFEMDSSMGCLNAKRVVEINLFAVQQAHDGGLFNTKD